MPCMRMGSGFLKKRRKGRAANLRVLRNLQRTKGSTLNKGELSAKLTEGIP